MEDLKKAFDELKSLIDRSDRAGINGTRVQEIKDLAQKVEDELKKLEE